MPKYSPSLAKNLIQRSLRGVIDPYPSIKEVEMLWNYYFSKCAYCGKVLDRDSRYGHIDHLLKRDSKNYNNIHNCVLACQECNGNEKREQDWLPFLFSKCKDDEQALGDRKRHIEEWINRAPTLDTNASLEAEIKEAIKIALAGYNEALSRLKKMHQSETENIISGQMEDNLMKYETKNEKVATDSEISVISAKQVFEYCSTLLQRFSENGTEENSSTTQIFSKFLEALYGAGFVISDFNGPQFDTGPMKYIFMPGLAPLIAACSNLVTIKMYYHTLARGFRGTYYNSGYPYFNRAYRSGGLCGLNERLNKYIEYAEKSGSLYLIESNGINLIKEIEF